MLSYCLKCTKNTERKNTKFTRTKNGIMMLLSRCSVCNNKKLNFFNPNLSKGGVDFTQPLSWFSPNNPEMVKAVTLVFCCMQ